MEVIEKISTNNLKEEKVKNQILLTHTSRNVIDYMVSIKYRYDGNPQKLPHYIVTRDGKLIKLLEHNINSNYSNNDRVNSKSIVISLENLGWLEKVPLKKHYINWIGNIYNGEIVDRKWRDYFLWQPYTDIQLEKTAELCKELSKEMGIKLACVGHNTKVKGCESYIGILTRSNFDEFVTDLSPAFNFEMFNKLLENE
jgi:N-acetyl-anhydromuramyl-L-alanine amidase AmpD